LAGTDPRRFSAWSRIARIAYASRLFQIAVSFAPIA